MREDYAVEANAMETTMNFRERRFDPIPEVNYATMPLRLLMLKYRHCNVSKIKDRAFGLLGLSMEMLSYGSASRYQMPCEEISKRIFKHYKSHHYYKDMKIYRNYKNITEFLGAKSNVIYAPVYHQFIDGKSWYGQVYGVVFQEG